VNGTPGERPFRKQALRPGDLLVLGKPLGSGIVLAAHMRALCPGPILAAALESMDQSNHLHAEWLAAHDVQCCTDISGFGLLGHLDEMLAPEQSAQLDLAALPLLPGALDLANQGIRSTLTPQNATRALPRW